MTAGSRSETSSREQLTREELEAQGYIIDDDGDAVLVDGTVTSVGDFVEDDDVEG